MNIIYDKELDARDLMEAEWRGVLDDITVEIGNSKYLIRVCNYSRLKIDIDAEIESSDQFLVDPGTIVIKGVVNRENIESAINILAMGGYFDLLLPISSN